MEKKSFGQAFKEELMDLIKHPKKLIPTFVLTGVWMLFSILSTVGVNIPAFRFLYTLTYANGGMFGGFFGAVGGLLGKAVFAGVVNTLVLAIVAKQNPFKGFSKGLAGIVDSSAKAVCPFLIGGGVGILCYFIFNVTSATQNCAIAVACAIAGVQALAKKNGLLFNGVFWLTKQFSKGKAPSRVTVSRVLAGVTAGFAISFPITFLRMPWLIVVLGVILLAVGIALPIFTGKKAVATAACLMILATALGSAVPAQAKDDGFKMTIDPMFYDHHEKYDQHFSSWDDWIYLGFYKAGEIKVERNSAGVYTFTIPGYDYSFVSADRNYWVTIPELTFEGTDFVYNETMTYYESKFNTTFDGIQTVYFYRDSAKGNVYTTVHELKNFELDLWFTKNGVSGNTVEMHSSGCKCTARNYDENVEDPDTYTTWSDYSGLFSQGFEVTDLDTKAIMGNSKTKAAAKNDSDDSEGEDEYKPYRGRLTYTNGRVNKYGQPFPDLMDFDDDGEITWLDMNIQKELSHDPDWLDRPVHTGMGVLLAILTGLGGAGLFTCGSAAAGALGGALGAALGETVGAAAGEAAAGAVGEAAGEVAGTAAGEAAGEATVDVLKNLLDNTSYIKQDNEGDLHITDPATGEQYVYVANGDGTYTNPLTGSTNDAEGFAEWLGFRERNADVLKMDADTANRAIAEQRAESTSGEKSWLTQKLEDEKHQEEARIAQEEKHDAYVQKLSDKYGVISSEEKVREKVAAEQGKAEIEGYEQREFEEEYRKSQEYCETTKKVADTAIDVLAEIEPTGTGKVIKDQYTVLSAVASNAGEVISGDKSVGSAIAQTVVDSGVGLIKNHAGETDYTGTAGYAEKFAANVMGDGVAATTNELAKGKSWEEAQKAGSDAAKQGGVNFLVDAGFDAVGAKFGTDSSDVAGKVLGSEITKKGVSDGSKTLGADIVKNYLSPDDEDDKKLDAFRAEQAAAEKKAWEDQKQHLEESKQIWKERKENGGDAGDSDKK